MRTLALVALATAACNATTGGSLVTFTARAGGPADAVAGAPLSFHSGSGFDVRLTAATLHLGAVYLDATRPASGAPEQPCILPGIYVGQAFAALDVNLLSPSLATFATAGQGTASAAHEADVWLTGGDIDAIDNPTPILTVAGTAARGAEVWPFAATITIGANRAIAPPSPAMPGANPICRQRIASLIPVDFTLGDGGTLDLRVNPRGMFNGVDFSTLGPGGSATVSVIPDTSAGAGEALYKGLVANAGVYAFTWTDQ